MNQVFFSNAKGSARKNRLDRVSDLFVRAGFAEMIRPGELVALKVHWGERGNVGFLPVPYVRKLVQEIKKVNGIPFVTDTNTLYTGKRRQAVDNIRTASQNGFCHETLGAPVIVADGLKGFDSREVSVPESKTGTVKIASGIYDADAMIVLSHVKSHMVFGFGGALKNLGMGCTTPAGKQFLHSDLRPVVDSEACRGDELCIERCPVDAIRMLEEVASIDQDRCIGCGECTSTCPHGAIPIRWKTSAESIMHKTAVYAKAAVSNKIDKVGYFNFLINITPDCDCCSWNEAAFVNDVGFLASRDPVAIDVASADLVGKMQPNPGGKAEGATGDIWKAVHPIEYRQIFADAEKIGLGSQQYQLVQI